MASSNFFLSQQQAFQAPRLVSGLTSKMPREQADDLNASASASLDDMFAPTPLKEVYGDGKNGPGSLSFANDAPELHEVATREEILSLFENLLPEESGSYFSAPSAPVSSTTLPRRPVPSSPEPRDTDGVYPEPVWGQKQSMISLNNTTVMDTDGTSISSSSFLSSPREDTWAQRYKELEHFVQKHGHALVPNFYAENRPLGKLYSL